MKSRAEAKLTRTPATADRERPGELPPSGVAPGDVTPAEEGRLRAMLRDLENRVEVPLHFEERVLGAVLGRESGEPLTEDHLRPRELFEALERRIPVPREVEARILRAVLQREPARLPPSARPSRRLLRLGSLLLIALALIVWQAWARR